MSSSESESPTTIVSPSTLTKTVKSIKQQQIQQLAKLQLKLDTDLDLLSDVRDYFKKRAEIESTYALSLEKINKQLAAKLLKSKKDPEAEYSRPIYKAFHTLLSGSDSISKIKAQEVVDITSKINDGLKEFLKSRTAIGKKAADFCVRYHTELHTSYDGLDKVKISYDRHLKDFLSYQKKYNNTLKKPSGFNALRNAIAKDQDERSEKARHKLNQAEQKLDEARNQYLTVLAGVNASQNKYYSEDLPGLMKKMEGAYYKTFADSLSKFHTFECDVVDTHSKSLQNLKTATDNIDGPLDLKIFLADYTNTFAAQKDFKYDAGEGDEGPSKLVLNDISKVTLGQQMGYLVERSTRMHIELEKKSKELAGIQSLVDSYNANPNFGNATNPLDQLAQLESEMGMMGLVLSFCDAQIALMKNSGVIPIKPATPELNGDAAQNSGGGGVGGLSDYTIGVAIPSSTLSRIGSVGSFAGTLAQRATVLYDHDAQEALEVSVREGDEVTIVKGENDGWITVRKRDGAEGMIPATYAKMLESTLHLPVASSMLNSALSMGSFSSTIPATTGAVIPPLQAVYDYNASEASEISFQAGDVIEVIEASEVASADAWWEGRNKRTGAIGSFPLAFTQGWEGVAVASLSVATAGVSLSRATSVKSVGSMLNSSLNRSGGGGGGGGALFGGTAATAASVVIQEERVKAVYEYKATCEGELDLQVGDMVTILNKDTGSEAWWEGESERGRGQFPSNYVEPSTGGTSKFSTSKRNTGTGAGTSKVRAIYDYNAGAPEELSFREGDEIILISSTDPDWWDGEKSGVKGVFPATYVERI